VPLIDSTYFVGELNIPNTDQPAVLNALNFFIERYEVEFLRQTLGILLYQDFMTALGQNPTTGVYANVSGGVASGAVSALYTQLLNGCDFVGLDTYEHHWVGFTSASIDGYTSPRSPIANYVYYWFMRDRIIQNTGIGFMLPKPENGITMSPKSKMVLVWNDMSDWVKELSDFIEVNFNAGNFLDWQPQSKCRVLHRFGPINNYSI
jgi:hypothetical protein